MRITFLILMAFSLTGFGQSINTTFGKNKVQYHDEFKNWWQYESNNFITYWYNSAKNVAQPTILMAEMDYDAIQSILQHRINDKIEIIVYTDISDLKQSNIGTEETFVNKTGETKIAGNKMFVYFDGNHQNLRKKIREGIAGVYFNNMLLGTNLQETIQNAVLLNIPDWYKDGIISYAASPWNSKIENQFRELWHRNSKFNNFDKLVQEHPRVAGHSMWFFIDQSYGRASIANLLYLTKISRSVENSFEYILNERLKDIKEEWADYYKGYFNSEKGKYTDNQNARKIKIDSKKDIPVSLTKLSPDGKQLIYVTNKLGKINIFVKDLRTGKEKRIFKYGYKNIFQETDFNYPLVAWHPNGKEISIIYQKKNTIRLLKYQVDIDEKMEQIMPNEFQRIYSISYKNDFNYVFSASTDGWSDLFYYDSKKRNQTRITQDFYDDLDANYVTFNGKRGILFSSNREEDTLQTLSFDTILPLRNFDIFFLPDGEMKAEKLTFTPTSNERWPMIYNGNHVVFTGDQTGIVNTYIYKPGSMIPQPLSNLDRHIISHSAVPGSDIYIKSYYKDDEFRILKETLSPDQMVKPTPTLSAKALNPHPTKNTPIVLPEPKYTDIIIEDGFLFQTEYDDPPIVEPLKIIPTDKIPPEIQDLNIAVYQKPTNPLEPYDNIRAVAANRKFSLNNFTTKLDNDLLFEGLETYTGDRQELLTTPLGFLVKANLKDIFEDHEIEVGGRIPTTFNGSEYFLIYENKKKRIDKTYALYRKSTKFTNETPAPGNLLTQSRKTSVLGMYQLKYPFDIYRSVRATGSLRFDKYLQLSTENQTFNAPAINEKRLSLKLEYIYDNTYDFSVNIKQGTRYKFFTEIINAFNLEFIDGVNLDLSKGFTTIVGLDARHYIPVLDKSILALRGASATSFGSQRMLYYLGGVENWLFPSFNQNVPVSSDTDFAYKANAFQMRGFNNNIRNGSTFVVTNAELRVPFMQYILGKNRGNPFFRNMQIVGFFDAGLAWYGWSPFGKENPLNTLTVSSPPLIELEVEYFRDPLVMGFGTGLRTQLLGYFIKLDYGWGIETRRILKPRIYLSLGYDF